MHPLRPSDYSLGPQLVHLVCESSQLTAITGAHYRHDPVPALSGVVPEETALVGRTRQHTLSGMTGGGTGISAAVTVRGSRDEVLDLRLLSALHAVQLSQFHDPHTLEQLGSLFAHVQGGDAVGEEALGQHPQQAALSDALRTTGDEDLVELAPGPHDPIHRRDHPQPGDGAVQLIVLGSQPPDEHGVQPLHAVPFQIFQIGLDGVILLLLRHGFQCIF